MNLPFSTRNKWRTMIETEMDSFVEWFRLGYREVVEVRWQHRQLVVDHYDGRKHGTARFSMKAWGDWVNSIQTK